LAGRVRREFPQVRPHAATVGANLGESFVVGLTADLDDSPRGVLSITVGDTGGALRHAMKAEAGW